MTDEELARFLQSGLPERPATPPELVYWRAQLQVRRQREERAAKPVITAQWGAMGAVLCASLAATPWSWWMGLVSVAVLAGAAVMVKVGYHSE